MPATAGELSERVRGIPGMESVLPALEGLAPAYLVGGAVRDLLRGADSIDLDIAVEGDALAAARTLAERLGGEAVEHERFGTATVRTRDVSFDLAATREESYPEPGALPSVRSASLADDLRRRDFTINAMAIALSPDVLGELHDPHGGRRDLEGSVVRVLHERSFLDDPTRLLRAVRYEARLAFRMEVDTERLVHDAVAARALDTVSGARVRDELLDLLAEREVAVAVARLAELRLDYALAQGLVADPDLVASAALRAGEVEADRVLAALAALVSSAPGELGPWLESLDLPAPRRDAVARAARGAPELVDGLASGPSPADLYELLRDEPPEALALALALGAPGEPVLRFVGELRDAKLEITGDDLVAAGIPPSPALGRALELTLRRKLGGELSGREAELECALDLARREQSL